MFVRKFHRVCYVFFGVDICENMLYFDRVISLRTETEQAERLKKFMKINSRIDLEKHQQDYNSCQAYLAGDQEQFNSLLESSITRTRKYILYDTSKLFNEQDKEDILSETLEIAMAKMATFKGWSRYSTWMRAIARYQIYKLADKKAKEIKCIDINEMANTLDVESRYSQPSEFRQELSIIEILSSLTKKSSQIVMLHVVEGLSFAEIAAELEISEHIVRKDYGKAIFQLRQELQTK